MNNFKIVETNDGHELFGELLFDNASEVLSQYPTLFTSKGAEPVNGTLKMSNLSAIDSAGLSVLLHWVRGAKGKKSSISLQGASSRMASLISISSLSEILLH